ncbi:MAG TPA: class I SAM-dependent methyltransferase [Trebonia sp.]|jgi:ubiquinone/menaquinone biosynthesis C-methylase UbiE|nr:class I SAM-dependent methyltransferase [Trebonia sp.]
MRLNAPPEVVKEQVAAGFAEAATRYGTSGPDFFADMGCRLVDLADVKPGMRVLDVGCGKGAVTIPAARLAGVDGHVHAIDLAIPMVEATNARARKFGLANITVEQGDAEDPPSSSGWPVSGFDAVLAGYVIQFLPRPELAVRRWLSLLRPGGSIGFSWGLAQDPAWIPAMAAIDAHVPAGVPGFEAFFRRPPFNGIDPVEHMLTSSGYHQVDTVISEVETVYESPGHWFAECRSQGPWAISWRHIPPARLGMALTDAFAALEGLRGPDGALSRTLTLAITTGRKPGGDGE